MLWSTCCSDLTSLDFFLWSFVVDNVFRASSTVMYQLKHLKPWTIWNILTYMLYNVWHSLQMNFSSLVWGKGGLIQNIMYQKNLRIFNAECENKFCIIYVLFVCLWFLTCVRYVWDTMYLTLFKRLCLLSIKIWLRILEQNHGTRTVFSKFGRQNAYPKSMK